MTHWTWVPLSGATAAGPGRDWAGWDEAMTELEPDPAGPPAPTPAYADREFALTIPPWRW